MKLKSILVILYFSLFAFNLSFAQSWIWGAEGVGDGGVQSVASDGHGNCYATGLLENDTIYFGSYTIKNSTITNSPYSSDEDAFLVKYASNGNVLWAKQTFEKNINHNFVTSSPVTVCADGQGNAYLSGNFIDTIFIGAYMLVTPESGPNPETTYLAK
jgi:hypothetical protein